jgi:hypothetical protein
VQRLRPGQSVPFTAEEQDESGLNLLVACTLAWEGVIVEGVDLPCTPDNVKMVYRRFPWLQEQVTAFIGDRANFLSR